MKYVRTARSYQALNAEGETVTGTPVKVSNEKADELVKLGAEHGVEVLVFDADNERDAAFEGVQHRGAQSGVAPDLAAGVAAITGTGDPVESPCVTPDGDEPEQAGQDASGQPDPALDPPATGTTTTRGRRAATTEGS
jgi:hypothetical protein